MFWWRQVKCEFKTVNFVKQLAKACKNYRPPCNRRNKWAKANSRWQEKLMTASQVWLLVSIYILVFKRAPLLISAEITYRACFLLLTWRPGLTVHLELRCHRPPELIERDLCFHCFSVAMKVRQADSGRRSKGPSRSVWRILVHHLLSGKGKHHMKINQPGWWISNAIV